eukprot:m.257192 g.257192  ORF g.257192 m.257192 type:complete len:356 (-) comp35052_c0_seq1:72-1139(-)
MPPNATQDVGTVSYIDLVTADPTIKIKPGEFQWSDRQEPHALRRTAILKAHPEIQSLFGPCSKTKWKVLVSVIFQTMMAYKLRNVSLNVLLFFAYFVSGTLNHMMTLALHELSHNLGFKTRWLNRWLAIVGNCTMGLPAAVQFKRYHLEHHKYQGEDEIDVDVPTYIEGQMFKFWIGKFVWVLLQPAFYSLRPLMVKPKVPGKWELINAVVVLTYDYLIYQYCGINGLIYLIGGLLLGMGLHPVAGHFIAEHYVLNPGFETMSYYGPLNWVTYNVGYHNEHHDFPNIPGSRLHQLRSMAPEFYDTLPQYESWSEVIFKYIWKSEITPFSRVKRNTMTNDEKTDLQARELKAHLAS